ncbi:MAG: hypothetical protein ACFNVI_10590 [Lachnoanaerobaculum gingivalis]
MKSLSRIIFFSILLFLFISCKKNENKDFTAAAIDIENSQREELLTVEEVKERLDLKNPEVREYFKPFYESLKILDVENPTIEDQIKLFYETIKVLDEEYYFNLFDFDYQPSDELKEIFHKIFLEDEIWQVIISNLHTKASQQPDRFLNTSKSIKIKNISIVSITDEECTCIVKAEASHWFYADRGMEFTKKKYFKYYDDICISEEESEKFYQKALQEYEKIGEGKFMGCSIKTEENHIFHLVKKEGIL